MLNENGLDLWESIYNNTVNEDILSSEINIHTPIYYKKDIDLKSNSNNNHSKNTSLNINRKVYNSMQSSSYETESDYDIKEIGNNDTKNDINGLYQTNISDFKSHLDDIISIQPKNTIPTESVHRFSHRIPNKKFANSSSTDDIKDDYNNFINQDDLYSDNVDNNSDLVDINVNKYLEDSLDNNNENCIYQNSFTPSDNNVDIADYLIDHSDTSSNDNNDNNIDGDIINYNKYNDTSPVDQNNIDSKYYIENYNNYNDTSLIDQNDLNSKYYIQNYNNYNDTSLIDQNDLNSKYYIQNYNNNNNTSPIDNNIHNIDGDIIDNLIDLNNLSLSNNNSHLDQNILKNMADQNKFNLFNIDLIDHNKNKQTLDFVESTNGPQIIKKLEENLTKIETQKSPIENIPDSMLPTSRIDRIHKKSSPQKAREKYSELSKNLFRPRKREIDTQYLDFDIDIIYSTILSESTTTTDAKKVQHNFINFSDYLSYFQPLLLNEIKITVDQVKKSDYRGENLTSTVLNVDQGNIYTEIDLSSTINNSLAYFDFVEITPVDRFKRKFYGIVKSVRSAKNQCVSTILSSTTNLFPSKKDKVNMCVLTNLSTHVREFGSLFLLQTLSIKFEIISPKYFIYEFKKLYNQKNHTDIAYTDNFKNTNIHINSITNNNADTSFKSNLNSNNNTNTNTCINLINNGNDVSIINQKLDTININTNIDTNNNPDVSDIALQNPSNDPLSLYSKIPFERKREIDLISQVLKLNWYQAEAISSCFSTKTQITLIQGPPGTGKTTTILGILQTIFSKICKFGYNNGRSPKVLICAPSNCAIDIIARKISKGLKLLDKSIFRPNIVRIGVLESIDQRLKKITLDYLTKNYNYELYNEQNNMKITNNIFCDCVNICFCYDNNKSKEKNKNTKDNTSSNKNNQFSINGNSKDGDKKFYDSKRRVIPGLKPISDYFHNNSHTKYISLKEKRSRIILRSDIICSTLSASAMENLIEDNLKIDMVIIDEACQCIETSALIPLKYNPKKLILVGDPQQLPPTVISNTRLLEISLFERLSRYYPVHILKTQYRMTSDIVAFPNLQFYRNQLITPKFLEQRKGPFALLLKSISFINIQGTEKQGDTNSFYNVKEEKAIVRIVNYLASKIHLNKNIGIISPYKKQILHIIEEYRKICKANLTDLVEINTVDAFQGQEKDIIILSTVRSEKLGFVLDIRRLNVALTRARFNIIILGNANLLETDKTWKALIQFYKDKKAFYEEDQFFHKILGKHLHR
ncbi:hypothetical protein EDEG_03389 [Edhazardia aedis USNM 41457]|uniref:AAA+ ATPase domain-containing protein n=1 Tax=Edhazardia aedis (strain USNM 41457) TaxID=1003232 RepID=J8ZR54_EDHAE|nr:hypothetical protein EDEG_03389 [Edhazardia aedis USNM 41457]|eukprot:EJW02168.1 hypothetical protein EDEG_03389 [Edhazardia aedis USNM 41457]